jgi:16S rRNA (guanine527-N7)-methyltransferase
MSSDQAAAARLNELLSSAGLPELDADVAAKFQVYLDLLMRWNGRVNLTSIREQEGILSRHFVESIVCARAVPLEVATLLDFGSGAGFPGIPIALCRPGIEVTLAESQGKKAAFLQEALRTLGLRAHVYSGRAERVESTFDCVALRAVDRMADAVRTAAGLVSPDGWLLLMATRAELAALRGAAGPELEWIKLVELPQGNDRLIAVGRRTSTV